MASCESFYLCGGKKKPEPGHSLGPYVSITFESSGNETTVSNLSSPNTTPQHVAVIKSFEFGHSDGLTVKVVIHDEQGGNFVRAMENLLKDFKCLKRGVPTINRMRFRFGWVKEGCGTPMSENLSNPYYALMDSVETNFTQGKFIYEITGKDLCYHFFDGSSDEIFGGDGPEALPLKQAIEQHLTGGKAGPNVGSVRFCKLEGGACRPVEFEIGGTEGPPGKYVAAGQNKMDASRRHIKEFLSKPTKSGRCGQSFIPQYNAESKSGELIFWEDRKPKQTQGDGYWDENCVGTYVVNAGKDSPVIEFNPKIKWNFASITTQGGGVGENKAKGLPEEGSKNPGLCVRGLERETQRGAGHAMPTNPSENAVSNWGTDADRKQTEANTEAQRGLPIIYQGVEADLVIVGDPKMLPPSKAINLQNVAIVLINPFYLTLTGSAACGEWLASPVCNEVLSSKAWMCKSMTHRIEAGRYTTTIGVFLAVPGMEIPPDEKLGAWTGGWQPKPC